MRTIASLGLEMGSGSINAARDVPQLFDPRSGLSGHMRVGAHLDCLLMCGYLPVAYGTDPLVGQVTTTVPTDLAGVGEYILPLTSSAGLLDGDWLQIGAPVAPQAVTVTDQSEVKQIWKVGPVNEVQSLTLLGTGLGGTYTLSYGGEASATITPTQSAITLQAKLEALTTIGAGNVTVAGSNTAGYTITGAGTKAAVPLSLFVPNTTSLTGTGAGVHVKRTVPGCAANTVALKTRSLFKHLATTPVKTVSPTLPVYHKLKHHSPEHIFEADYWTLYLEWGNPKNRHKLLLYDGKNTQFNYTTNMGAIATYQMSFMFLNATRDALLTDRVVAIADPSAIPLQNTRGTFSVMGNATDAPLNLAINLTANVYEDGVLTHFQKQSGMHLDHTLTGNYSGKFAADYYDKAVYGAEANNSVSDSLYESAVYYKAESPVLIGTSQIPYSFSFNAPVVQFGNYNASFNTNQPVQGAMEAFKVVNDIADDSEDWEYVFVNSATGDIYGASAAY